PWFAPLITKAKVLTLIQPRRHCYLLYGKPNSSPPMDGSFNVEKGSNCYRVSWIYDKSRKNYLSFSYTSDRLSKIQDNIGREITIAYSSNKIQVKYQGVTCVTYTLGGGKKPELTSVTVPINAQDNAVTEYSYGDGRNIR